MSKRAARIELFRRGYIAPWYLRPDQKPVHDFIKKHRFPVFESTRRYGKTTIDLVIVQEFLNRNPKSVWRWCAPWKNQAREIVMPEMEKIQDIIPRWFKFKFHKVDSYYENPKNGSRLYLRGVNEDKGESSRGTFAHGITADELGSWNEPSYIINEVLMPQLLTTGGPLHFLSTPPEDLGHLWYTDIKKRAVEGGRFIQRIITDNASLTQDQIKEMIEAMGGMQSAAVRRELFCEPVADPEKLVIPEYDEKKHDVDDTYPRPTFFDAYVSADLGFHDNTALLFGYHDFARRELIIEDELVVAGKNSQEIVTAAKAIEQRLWGREPKLRVSDNDLQQLYDMSSLCGYQMVPTRKDDKLAAINDLRIRFAQGRIKINKRCTNLRYQLKVGLWNDRRTGFVRSENIGHLDAVDALVYMHRNIDERHNPYPSMLGINPATHYIPPERAAITSDGEALAGALFPFRDR